MKIIFNEWQEYPIKNQEEYAKGKKGRMRSYSLQGAPIVATANRNTTPWPRLCIVAPLRLISVSSISSATAAPPPRAELSRTCSRAGCRSVGWVSSRHWYQAAVKVHETCNTQQLTWRHRHRTASPSTTHLGTCHQREAGGRLLLCATLDVIQLARCRLVVGVKLGSAAGRPV